MGIGYWKKLGIAAGVDCGGGKILEDGLVEGQERSAQPVWVVGGRREGLDVWGGGLWRNVGQLSLFCSLSISFLHSVPMSLFCQSLSPIVSPFSPISSQSLYLPASSTQHLSPLNSLISWAPHWPDTHQGMSEGKQGDCLKPGTTVAPQQPGEGTLATYLCDIEAGIRANVTRLPNV